MRPHSFQCHRSARSLERFNLAKIQQRQNLLAQDPEVAQAIANQTLYPHLWQQDNSQPWTESLEPNYGTPDP